jgi:DNA-binding transcriptional ArsR family regulator
MKPPTKITDPRVVKAIAHPLRLRIISVLEHRTASPKEIADDLGADLGVVSYHVRQLERFGLIKCIKHTQRRGAIQHTYRLEARPSITDEAWDAAPEIAKQALVGAVLGQVSSQVNAAAASAGFSRQGAHLSRLPLELDAQGWKEVSGELERLAERLVQIQDDSRNRLAADHDEEPAAALAVLMLFEQADPSLLDAPPRKKRRAPPAHTRG